MSGTATQCSYKHLHTTPIIVNSSYLCTLWSSRCVEKHEWYVCCKIPFLNNLSSNTQTRFQYKYILLKAVWYPILPISICSTKSIMLTRACVSSIAKLPAPSLKAICLSFDSNNTQSEISKSPTHEPSWFLRYSSYAYPRHLSPGCPYQIVCDIQTIVCYKLNPTALPKCNF